MIKYVMYKTGKGASNMEKKESFWIILCGLLILLAYIIPYTVLTDVVKWYGSFLLWLLLGLVIIVVNFVITKDWRS